jgi:tetratricopeptide (TPR) repeat protein
LSLELATARVTCKICQQRRAQRYCLRTGKDICWVCCNDNRIDDRCPQECQYIVQKPQEKDNSLPMASKVDSLSEHNDLLKRHINIWLEMPEKMFSGQTPANMVKSDEGRKKLEEYVEAISNKPALPISYLRQKLGLPQKKGVEAASTYEDVAEEYIKKLAVNEWDDLIAMQAVTKQYKKELYRKNYIKRRNNTKLFRMINSWHLILSGYSQEGGEAIVYFEVNHKFDLTLHMTTVEQKWKVKSIILGNPKFYYGEGEAIKQITALLAQNKKIEAYNQLKQYFEVLIDSPEIHYLYGLYHAMNDDLAKSQDYFLNAAEIDPDYYDAKYNLAFTLHNAQDFVMAKELYLELLETNPKDVKVLNNLAVIFEAEKNFKKAWDLIIKSLEIDPKFEMSLKNKERMSQMYGYK